VNEKYYQLSRPSPSKFVSEGVFSCTCTSSTSKGSATVEERSGYGPSPASRWSCLAASQVLAFIQPLDCLGVIIHSLITDCLGAMFHTSYQYRAPSCTRSCRSCEDKYLVSITNGAAETMAPRARASSASETDTSRRQTDPPPGGQDENEEQRYWHSRRIIPPLVTRLNDEPSAPAFARQPPLSPPSPRSRGEKTMDPPRRISPEEAESPNGASCPPANVGESVQTSRSCPEGQRSSVKQGRDRRERPSSSLGKETMDPPRRISPNGADLSLIKAHSIMNSQMPTFIDTRSCPPANVGGRPTSRSWPEGQLSMSSVKQGRDIRQGSSGQVQVQRSSPSLRIKYPPPPPRPISSLLGEVQQDRAQQRQSFPGQQVKNARRSSFDEGKNSTRGIDGSDRNSNRSNTGRVSLSDSLTPPDSAESTSLSDSLTPPPLPKRHHHQKENIFLSQGSAVSTYDSVTSPAQTMRHHNKIGLGRENSLDLCLPDLGSNGRSQSNSTKGSSTQSKKHRNKKIAHATAAASSSSIKSKEEESQNKHHSVSSSFSTASSSTKSISNSSIKKPKKKSKNRNGNGASENGSNKSNASELAKHIVDTVYRSTSNEAASSIISKVELRAPSSNGVSAAADKSLKKKKSTSNIKNGIKSSTTTENNTKKKSNGSKPIDTESSTTPINAHSSSRPKGILRKNQHPCDDDDADEKASSSCQESVSSGISNLRKHLTSYCAKKRRETNQEREEQQADMKKKNPYALDDKNTNGGSLIHVSSIEQHDVTATPSSSAHAIDYDVQSFAPPALVMVPKAADISRSVHSGINSVHSGINSVHSSINSSLHHHSLHSIQEGDILRDNNVMKQDEMKHSFHSSDGGIIRGRSRDALKFSTHSEGTGVTSMTNTTGSTLESGPLSPRVRVNLNTLLSLHLPVHQEGSLSGFESSSMGSTIMTNYSANNHRRPLMGSPSKGLTRSALAISDDTTHIINLPWTDDPDDNFGIDPTKRIQGKYTGPVNADFLQPHGEGTLAILNCSNDFLTFFGRWNNGKLESHLSAEPEGEECQVRSASIEGRRGSSNDPSPENSPIRQKSRNRLAHDTKTHDDTDNDESFSRDFAITTDRDVDIKYVINKSSKPKTADGKRRQYSLGDACRTPNDMIIHRSNQKAIQSTSLLKKWDQAFVKRSNGLWTVAVLIDRSLQPKNMKHRRHEHARWCTVWEIDPRSMELEESMLFAINGEGATKIINKKSWGEFVRRIT